MPTNDKMRLEKAIFSQLLTEIEAVIEGKGSTATQNLTMGQYVTMLRSIFRLANQPQNLPDGTILRHATEACQSALDDCDQSITIYEDRIAQYQASIDQYEELETKVKQLSEAYERSQAKWIKGPLDNMNAPIYTKLTENELAIIKQLHDIARVLPGAEAILTNHHEGIYHRPDGGTQLVEDLLTLIDRNCQILKTDISECQEQIEQSKEYKQRLEGAVDFSVRQSNTNRHNRNLVSEESSRTVSFEHELGPASQFEVLSNRSQYSSGTPASSLYSGSMLATPLSSLESTPKSNPDNQQFPSANQQASEESFAKGQRSSAASTGFSARPLNRGNKAQSAATVDPLVELNARASKMVLSLTRLDNIIRNPQAKDRDTIIQKFKDEYKALKTESAQAVKVSGSANQKSRLSTSLTQLEQFYTYLRKEEASHQGPSRAAGPGRT